MEKRILPMMIEEKKEAEFDVLVGRCCDEQKGLLAQVEGAWWLIRDCQRDGALATTAFRVGLCRGCYRLLDEDTLTELWKWGRDEQIDDHLHQIAREMRGRARGEKSCLDPGTSEAPSEK